MKILVIAEQRQGKWNNSSFETLAAAQQIASASSATVSALVIGKGVAALASELATKNVAEVLLVEHDLLDAYTPDGYCAALKQVIEGAKPDLVLFPHTYQVRDFAPKLAAMLGKGMVGDCVGFRSEGGKLVFVRQMFQGKTAADVTFTATAPWFASFQSGAFRADQLAAHPSGKAPVNTLALNLNATDIRTKPLELFKEAKSAVDLTQAPLIVSIGRGIKAPENIAQAEALAKAMGAELAASRPICDEGWLNEGRAHHRCRQQRPERAHLRNRRLRHRRRHFRSHARPHRSSRKSQVLALLAFIFRLGWLRYLVN